MASQVCANLQPVRLQTPDPAEVAELSLFHRPSIALSLHLVVLGTHILAAYITRVNEYAQILETMLSYISMMDVLYSFYVYSKGSGGAVCKPTFVRREQPYLMAKGLRHPFIRFSGTFIPNDVEIGGDGAPLWVISGPNMGGKSTLLRQCCILIILAQIGCFVPATECELTPVDQIFTRLGASDRIFSNQSTFMVELKETSDILVNATKHSMVIMDELGRGTSTFDGYSIAYAVVKKLCDIGCRALFATHYHKLNDEFKNSQQVALGHMDCQERQNSMVFLYKMVPGPCPKSYGMNVASMANIPWSIVSRASQMASNFEENVENKISDRSSGYHQDQRNKEFLKLLLEECIERDDLLKFWQSLQ